VCVCVYVNGFVTIVHCLLYLLLTPIPPHTHSHTHTTLYHTRHHTQLNAAYQRNPQKMMLNTLKHAYGAHKKAMSGASGGSMTARAYRYVCGCLFVYVCVCVNERRKERVCM
jgi:hypothetical protein